MRDSWQRVGLVLTMLWAAGVVLLTIYQYEAVSNGARPTRLIGLRDVKSGEEFNLSRGEIKELGRLVLKKSLSADAEPGDNTEAKFLLAAEPKPILHHSWIALWIILPAACLWGFLLGSRWLAGRYKWRRERPTSI